MKLKLTFLFVFTSILSVYAQEDSLKKYVHPVLGLSLSYPSSWSVISVDDYFNQLENTKLTNEEFDEMILKHAQVPLFAITKYKEPYDNLNPSIKINTRHYGNLKGYSPESILYHLIDQFKVMFTDFKLVQIPVKTKIGNQEAFYIKINYTYLTQNGLSFPTCSELWMLDKTDYFYFIGAGTRADDNSGAVEEIHKILNTFEIQ